MKTYTLIMRMALASIAFAASATQAADITAGGRLPDAQLDRIRGGFDFGNNMPASFALQRTVLVNGMEAMRTSISVPDIAHITSDQASALQSALQTTVITNGAGGVTASLSPTVGGSAQASAPGAASAANAGLAAAPVAGLVIQNSLDNQAITATTTIDASVNTGHMLENMRVAESIKDAVIQFRGN